MDNAQIVSTLRNIVAESAEIEPDAVAMDAHFIKDLDLDSMLLLEIAAKVEKAYKVKIDEADLKQLTTLREAVKLAERYVAKQGR